MFVIVIAFADLDGARRVELTRKSRGSNLAHAAVRCIQCNENFPLVNRGVLRHDSWQHPLEASSACTLARLVERSPQRPYSKTTSAAGSFWPPSRLG